MDYISATTSYDLQIPADDVETFSADEKTGLFQMIEDGKNLLKSLLYRIIFPLLLPLFSQFGAIWFRT